MTLEAGFIQLDRMAVEKGMVAFAAAWSCAGALGGYAIRGMAVRADDMQSVTHHAFLIESIMIIGYGAARQKKKGLRNIVPLVLLYSQRLTFEQYAIYLWPKSLVSARSSGII